MGDESRHLKFVSYITHRPLHSAGLATRVMSVCGQEICKMGMSLANMAKASFTPVRK